MTAFTSVNPISIGDPTKKSHYDVVFDNTLANKERVEKQHTTAGEHFMKHLRNVLYPIGNSYNDIYKSGWRPFFFNQKWGGAFGGEYPNGVGSKAWFETGQIQDDNFRPLGVNAVSTWCVQSFKVSQAITVQALWVKMYKTGDPQKNTEPLEIHIASALVNGAGTTIIANGTANAINGESMASAAESWPITDDINGEWYRCTFAINPTLSANTTYYLVLKATGTDATNNFQWKQKSVDVYPHGSRNVGDDAVPANWTADALDMCFLIETTEATQLLQSGGQFNGKLKFIEGLPLNQSQFLTNEIKNMYSGEGDFSFEITTESCALTASKTIADIMMGSIDHDRIRLYTDATPNLCLDVWENDGTKHSITDGATDVSGAAVRTIMVRVRHKNDGSDAVELLLNGAAEGTQLSSKSIYFDPNFADKAKFHLGGGFPDAITWDKNLKVDKFDGGLLPSNAGYATFTTGTAAVEASCFMIMDSPKALYQNGAYYAVGNENGYYLIDVPSLADATGGYVEAELKIMNCVNTSEESACWINISTDNNTFYIDFHEYYFETRNLATNFKYQYDFMSKPVIVGLSFKGSDLLIYLDGKLVMDCTGLFTAGAGDTQVLFGDNDMTAGSDATVIWYNLKIYDGGNCPVQVNSLLQLSEFAFWSADMTDLAALLYNAGTPKSVKELCGLKQNYVERINQVVNYRGITTPTFTGTDALLAEMESFILVPFGAIEFALTERSSHSAALSWGGVWPNVDGKHPARSGGVFNDGVEVYSSFTAADDYRTESFSMKRTLLAGLHRLEVWVDTGSATLTIYNREMTIKEIE